MPEVPTAPTHVRPPPPPLLPVVVAVAAAVVLGAGALGALPAYASMAGAVGVAAAVCAGRLIRLAPAGRNRRTGGFDLLAGHLAVGVVAVGVVAVALPLAPPRIRPLVAFGGLLVALVNHLLGLFLLSGAATTVRTRLRRGFDGLSLGVSLVFAALVALPLGHRPPVALAGTLIAAGSLAIVAVLTLGGGAAGPVLRWSAAGAAAGMIGLAGLVDLLAYGAAPARLPLAAAPLVVGFLLTASAAERARQVGGWSWPVATEAVTGSTGQPGPDGLSPGPELPSTCHPSAFPLLTVPAVVATAAASYHLLAVGDFDRLSIAVGLAVIPTMVVREILAALDIRRYARRLAAQGEHFRSMVSGANDLVLVVGADLTVRWQSPAAARLFALADAEVVGRQFADLIHPDDVPAATAVLAGVLDRARPWSGRPPLVAARLRDGHGAWRDTEATVSDQLNVPEVAALVMHVRDVGERRRLEKTVRQLALSDQLTGLANRRELMRAIVTQRMVPDHLGALLVVDLHGLATVNDRSGRVAGDAALVEAGRRIRAAVRDDDVVARLAGDEFAVVTVDGPMLAYALATRLLAVLAEPYLLPGATAQLQVSIGLAELSAGDAVDDVLRRADLARRRAGQLGRNRVEWYDSCLEEQLLRRLDLERELPGAIRRGELDLVYQPVVGLAAGVPVGMEALVRWRSPILGTVLPAELLPVAENLGLVEEVGQWVLHRACRQLADWSSGGRPLWMAVNASPTELAGVDVVGRFAETLATHQLAADRLVVEVAEPRLTADVTGLASRLTGLRELGIRTALDDFGAAQASLAHLRRLPFDYLKIDHGPLGEAAAAHGTGLLISIVAGLGRRLGWEVVAEGLESVAQIEQARAAGCRLGQGFALARSAPAERVEAYLEEFPSPSR